MKNTLWPPLPNVHSHAYQVLLSDYSRLLDYVDPVDANVHTYSQRTYELLVRACTEIEAVLRTVIAPAVGHLPARSNMSHYRQARDVLELVEAEVGLLFWKPVPKYLRPFGAWSQPEGSLGWYQDYNAAKHDTSGQLHRARFESLTSAIAALFALHFLRSGYVFFHPFSTESQTFRQYPDGRIEQLINHSFLSIRLSAATLKAVGTRTSPPAATGPRAQT